GLCPACQDHDRCDTVLQRVENSVFQYYKQLIDFRGFGEPRQLMRCINPREAEFLDAAAGVHIRFRLGGTKFPPNIYYKIFTHRPIVDMCANSPKDYAKHSAKEQPPGESHGKIGKDECSGWYKRIENNGWRLLSIRLNDTKEMEFHYSKLKRKQEIEQKRKRRKIEWMKKIPLSLFTGYYSGKLQVNTTDPIAICLIQRAAQGIINSAETKGPDDVMEWEVDEMLKWTNSLNFEE
uniref:Chromosome 11 open reading frame 65 n=1 Tax=Sphenodon punctatus TaxID=8508 RepID=A0A8D0HJY5_SPHPU